MIPTPNPSPADMRVFGRVALGLIAFCSALFVYVLHGAMPFNPIHLPFERFFATRYWAPEGWGFFTRDPREERVLVYKQTTSGAWISAALTPHSRPANVFGLNRKSRAQGIEAGLLLVHVGESDWTDCHTAPEQCLTKAPLVETLPNHSPEPTLCGEVGLALQKPLPWAWTHSRSHLVMPSRVARVRTRC